MENIEALQAYLVSVKGEEVVIIGEGNRVTVEKKLRENLHPESTVIVEKQLETVMASYVEDVNSNGFVKLHLNELRSLIQKALFQGFELMRDSRLVPVTRSEEADATFAEIAFSDFAKENSSLGQVIRLSRQYPSGVGAIRDQFLVMMNDVLTRGARLEKKRLLAITE